MSEEVLLQAALARMANAGAAQADALLVRGERLDVRVRGEEIDFVQQSQTRTLGLRALVEGDAGFRQASTSTSDLSTEEVERMADETVALARATAVDGAAGLPEEGLATDLPDLELFDPADRPWKVEDRVEAAREAERAARSVDPRVSNSEGSEAGARFSEVSYGSSRGFRGRYAGASYSLASGPVVEASGEKQIDYWYSVSRTLSGLEGAADVGRRAAERALRRLGSRAVATCEVPVLFESHVAASLLRHLFGCLSGYALYRGSSFLADRLGDRIASSRVTVIDDGRLPGGLGSRPFDGEGQATRRNVIVREGHLERYLFDSYSGRKLGMASTGNASRAAGSAPGVGPTNLWLEPGEPTLEALIAETDRGFLVTELMGQGFSPVTGDYSRGAAGLWIENGELAYPVHEVTIAGNLGSMLEAVDGIASDLEWRGPVSAPSLRISRMTVAGQ